MVYMTEENAGGKTKFYIRSDRIYLKFTKIKLVILSTFYFFPIFFLHFAAISDFKNIIKIEVNHKELDTTSKL